MDKREFERRQLSQNKILPKQKLPDLTGKIFSIDHIKPGDTVVIVCRVSGRRQKSHLKHQREAIIKSISGRGVIILETVNRIGPGQDISWLSEVIDKIKSKNHEGRVWILAECPDRLVRSLDYDNIFNPEGTITEEDLNRLMEATKGVSLAVLCLEVSPDMQRSTQTKRGLSNSKIKSGRSKMKTPGFKKLQKTKFLNRAVELNLSGYSFRGIADIISKESGNKISHVSIRNWIENYPNKKTKVG